MQLYEYPGALHIHTTYSDGTGTIPQIAAAARQAGLKWIVISDHDSLAGKDEAGWYGDLAVLVGYEISPEHSHYLVLGLSELVPPTLPPAEFVAAVRARGGWGFVLHPDERAGSYFKVALPWRDWSIRGFDGIEIWNYMSEWTDGITERNRYGRFFFPFLAIHGPTARTLAWWDQLLAAGERAAAVVGLDVHATRYRLMGRFPVEVYSYRRQFGTLTNYLLLREPLAQEWPEAARQICAGLAEGRSFMAYRAWGEGRGFRFLAQREGMSWIPGEKIPPGGGVHLTVHSPRWGCMYLLHDGQIVARTWGRQLRVDVDKPGVYRVEVRRFGRPWLFSNPICLG
jgi:hypothetical protein